VEGRGEERYGGGGGQSGRREGAGSMERRAERGKGGEDERRGRGRASQPAREPGRVRVGFGLFLEEVGLPFLSRPPWLLSWWVRPFCAYEREGRVGFPETLFWFHHALKNYSLIYAKKLFT